MDFTDVIAVFLGIWLTIRKLDVRWREPDQFPQVPPDEFASWKKNALLAYNVGGTACFLKVAGDIAFVFLYVNRAHANAAVVMVVGLTIFVGWLAALVFTFVRARAARGVQLALGIDLSRPMQKPE
jgi:hypothetical protein